MLIGNDAVVSADGWYNAHTKKTDQPDIFRSEICELIYDGSSVNLIFNIDKKIYRIRGSVVKSKRRDKKKQKEYILSLYFIMR